MSRQEEYDLQVQVAEYLKMHYPQTLFRSDYGGIRLSMGQAVKAKRTQLGRGWPDLNIAEPRGGYAGLFLELKATPADLYTKAGEIRQTQHLKEQARLLATLEQRGYSAKFAAGFNEARRIIDEYLSLQSFGLARQ